VKSLGLDNGLIVTDHGVSRAGLLSKVSQPLDEQGLKVAIYEDVQPEPTISSIETLLDLVKKSEYQFLIGLGGGSSMDTAKAVSLLLNNPGAPEDYFAGGEKGFSKIGIPCITVPTTAGTGAEITWDSVVKNRQGIKDAFEHPYVIPTLAVVDPLMSSTMSPRLTASTGVDALCHAVESTLTRLTSPFTRPLALESIRLIASNLRTAVYQGDNIESRYNMALATLLGAFSETNAGDIESHAVGSLLGSYYPIPHGTACAIALPYAMEHNLVVVPDRLKLIAAAMGEDITGVTAREAAYICIYAVRRLIEDVGLPTTLQEASKEYGMTRDDLPKLAKAMVTVPAIKIIFDFTLRAMTEEIALQFLNRMWDGQIGKP